MRTVVLPATTFLKHKEVMGAYGHLFAQISQPAIAPLGEARSNVWLFGELGRRMFPGEVEFEVGEEELIAQALETEHPYFAGVTKERLEAEGHVGLSLPKDERGESLPFSTREWFKSPSGRGELTPVPVWVAPIEFYGSRAGPAEQFPSHFLREAGEFDGRLQFARGELLMERRR